MNANLHELIRKTLEAELGDSYDCIRHWSAWNVGTMRQDDFYPVTNRLEEIVESIVNALRKADAA